MKVTQLSLKMFLDSVKALDTAAVEVREKAQYWLGLQEDRQVGYTPDAYVVNVARSNLEDALEHYREQLAHTYDFMGDKGFVNFVPTGVYVDDSE